MATKGEVANCSICNAALLEEKKDCLFLTQTKVNTSVLASFINPLMEVFKNKEIAETIDN